jgi:hypothetical protein
MKRVNEAEFAITLTRSGRCWRGNFFLVSLRIVHEPTSSGIGKGFLPTLDNKLLNYTYLECIPSANAFDFSHTKFPVLKAYRDIFYKLN